MKLFPAEEKVEYKATHIGRESLDIKMLPGVNANQFPGEKTAIVITKETKTERITFRNGH